MDPIVLRYLLILLVWSALCVGLGRIWQRRQDEREDLAARDAWAERYQHEHEGAA